MKKNLFSLTAAASVALAGGASAAITLDGQGIPSEGLALLATQSDPTTFGDAVGGGQDSAGGGELNQIFGGFDAMTGKIELGITGNVEGNFNKLWVFFDAVAGGENVLLNDNADGGFGEINNMAGLTFDAGFTADHGLRFEVGDGFFGVNRFDLIDNTGSSVVSGGGPGDLPLSDGNAGGDVVVGWDNSNVLGVDGASAAGAATATTGIELSIDVAALFGAAQSDVNIAVFYGNGDGSFISSQVLAPSATGDNLGTSSAIDFSGIAGNQFVTISNVPEPASLALVALGGVAMLGRRRSA
ncbi:MAG: PEP-CTERM sorting domain-containing protein [Planctomycetota bacterium]